MDLEGKVAIVTGGSMGIGTSVCMDLAMNGADVALTYRKHGDEAKAIAEEITKMGRKAVAYKVDVSDFDGVQNLVNEVATEFGRLDITFNNAGGFGPVAPLGQQADEDFDRIFEVNVKGVFLCMKAQIQQIMRPKELIQGIILPYLLQEFMSPFEVADCIIIYGNKQFRARQWIGSQFECLMKG